MNRVLLVTNDFPPRPGGIQSYLQEFVRRLCSLGGREVIVYAPRWKNSDAFDAAARDGWPAGEGGYRVVRHPGTLMLPVPGVAARMRRLIVEHQVDTVWFGAAAPLAVLAQQARCAGARRVVTSTHGHEVGWSMVPPARAVLRRVGDTTDVVTFVSRYARSRFASAFGPRAALEYLPSGVDTERFGPDPFARAELRRRYGLGDRPVVVCVSRLVPRKGQDMLIRALPAIRRHVDDATLVIVGGGPYLEALRRLAGKCGVADNVIFTRGVPFDELPAHYALGDVFAMPCRTRGAGFDVEGLGIVFLEASASGIPVVAGRSGGAPETVVDNHTGLLVDGTSISDITTAVGDLLANPQQAARMGAAGREWTIANWRWNTLVGRLGALLDGS